VATVRAASERLRRAGLLVKAGRGSTAADDPPFAEYLQARTLDPLKSSRCRFVSDAKKPRRRELPALGALAEIA
jgi:hypothetical protein